MRTTYLGTIWCPRTGLASDEEKRVRLGCAGRTGCGSDFFFCHLPHYPHGLIHLKPDANLTLRAYGLLSERKALEAASKSLGCAPGQPTCAGERPGRAAFLEVSEAELAESERALLPVHGDLRVQALGKVQGPSSAAPWGLGAPPPDDTGRRRV